MQVVSAHKICLEHLLERFILTSITAFISSAIFYLTSNQPAMMQTNQSLVFHSEATDDLDNDHSSVSGVEYSEDLSNSQVAENNNKDALKNDREADQLTSMTKNENTAVFWLRMLLIGCLFVSAIIVSVFV